jgi:hypothetical protein
MGETKMIKTEFGKVTKQRDPKGPELNFSVTTPSRERERKTIAKHSYAGVILGSQGWGKTRKLVNIYHPRSRL